MDRMQKSGLFKDVIGGKTTKGRAEQFFMQINGLYEIKELIFRALDADDSINLMINGPDMSAKAIFVDIIIIIVTMSFILTLSYAIARI